MDSEPDYLRDPLADPLADPLDREWSPEDGHASVRGDSGGATTASERTEAELERDRAVDDLLDDVKLDEEPPPAPAQSGPVRTGDVEVDAVIAELEGLDDLPLDLHAQAFERAHTQLRNTLDRPTTSS